MLTRYCAIRHMWIIHDLLAKKENCCRYNTACQYRVLYNFIGTLYVRISYTKTFESHVEYGVSDCLDIRIHKVQVDSQIDDAFWPILRLNNPRGLKWCGTLEASRSWGLRSKSIYPAHAIAHTRSSAFLYGLAQLCTKSTNAYTHVESVT